MECSEFIWIGNEAMHLDAPYVLNTQEIIVGMYGGNSSTGANKNEDAALVWRSSDHSWEFTAILDAHHSSESAALVVRNLMLIKNEIIDCLSNSSEISFDRLQNLIIALFSSDEFLHQCKSITGETSCLICARKGAFLWWLNIGDCILYLFHEELVRLGQYALNQRNYYEWIGYQSSFHSGVPCYTSGTRELRNGKNMIVVATDGLLEFGNHPYENPEHLYDFLKIQKPLASSIKDLLGKVHLGNGRDSATIIAWMIESPHLPCYPSDQMT